MLPWLSLKVLALCQWARMVMVAVIFPAAATFRGASPMLS